MFIYCHVQGLAAPGEFASLQTAEEVMALVRAELGDAAAAALAAAAAASHDEPEPAEQVARDPGQPLQ
jgi:cytochrome c553